MPEVFTAVPAAQGREGRADTAWVAVPEPTAQALRYHRGNTALWAADTLLGLAVPAALLFTGGSARLRRLAARVSRGRWLPTVALYGALLSTVMWLAYLPFAWYVGYLRQHAYGLSTQSAGQWLGDWGKSVLVGAAVTALVLWIPYLLLRASPRRWWLWTGLAALPLGAAAMLVGPVWIAPLFDEFGPMRDRTLEARILAVAKRAGIEGGRVYEVRKSDDTRMVNAYVTGIGGTKRIVLWDTILQKLEPDEVVFVMAHEMGHFVLHHTLAVILGAALLATLSLFAVHRVADRLIARFAPRFGFDRLADVASLPLLMLVGGTVSFLVTPPVLAYSRWQEHEADRFALELTRDNRAGARTFVRLQQENLGVPRPGLLSTLWRGSHPSLASRVEFANTYRPWDTGRPLRYEKRFSVERQAPAAGRPSP